MDNLETRFNELVQERAQAIARVNELTGAMQEIQRIANPEPQKETTTETEEETNG